MEECFLVGQVIYVYVSSSEILSNWFEVPIRTCKVMMNVYEYTTGNMYVISWLSKATKILLVEITPHVEHADSASVYFKHSWQCRRPQWVYPLSSRWWHRIQGAFTYWCHHKNCWSDYWIYQWMNPSCGESSAEMFSPLEATIWISCKVEKVCRCREYLGITK